MKAAQTTSLFLAFMAVPAFAAKNKPAGGYFIDTSFTVRSTAEITKTNSAGKLSDYHGLALSVSEVEGKPEWRKITSPSGNFAFVHKDALVRVDVAPNYRIRKDTPDSKEKLGTTSTKNENLIFTGQMKTTKDKKGTEAKWLEVWSNGKIGWLAADSSKLALAKARAAKTPSPTRVALAAKSQPAKSQPAKAADEPKAKPETKRPAALTTAPAAKPAPVVTAAPEVKTKPVEPPKEAPKPAAPKANERECVNTEEQFTKNERLTKAYGGSSPFTEWSGEYSIKIKPIGARWEVTIPEWVLSAKGLNPDLKKTTTPLKICVDASNKPFIHVYGKDYQFNDTASSSITINHPDAPTQPIKFQRAGVAR